MMAIILVGIVLMACIAGALIVVLVGFFFNLLGSYDRTEETKYHLDNDEYDYGHNVKYTMEDDL